MAEPKVRFKRDDGSEFPAWKTIPISDVFAEVSEKNHPDMPVLSVQQGVGTVLRDSSDRNILYDKSNLRNYKVIKRDDFIIHLRSFEGGLECSNHDGISSPAYRILRPQAILSAAYRDYFRSYNFIHNKLAVSVVGIRDGKNIDMDTFWQISMSVPCLEEQRKIANFLSCIDEVISACKEEVLNLMTQKKVVMKKIFSQDVRFKRTDWSDFPEWQEAKLGEIASAKVGSKPDRILEEKTDFEYINAGTTNSGYVNAYNRKGDVTTTPSRGQGGIGVVGYQEKAFWLGPLCYGIQSRVESILNKYLYLYIDNNSECIMSCVKTGSIPAVNQEDLIQIVIRFPCIEEQRFIVDFLSDFDEVIAAAKKELELWKELKKGLLQQIFV